MRRDDQGGRSRWLASSVAATIVMVGIFFLSSIPRLPEPVRVEFPARKLAVELANSSGTNRMMNDESLMQDQTPLFLPTERNTALRPPKRPEAGRTVLDKDALHFSFSENDLKLNIPMPERVPEKAIEVLLADPASSQAYGMGRTAVEVQPFGARGGIVDILASGTNQRVLSIQLEVAAKPATEKVWRPLEFLGRIDPVGLVGPLVITQRSEVEEVDNYFRNYLVRTLRIGERLAPGSYRIVVGP